MSTIYIDLHGYKRLIDTHELIHRIIASAKFSRALRWFEVVHHIDGNKLNNHPNNLFICSKQFHELVHKKNIFGILLMN